MIPYWSPCKVPYFFNIRFRTLFNLKYQIQNKWKIVKKLIIYLNLTINMKLIMINWRNWYYDMLNFLSITIKVTFACNNMSIRFGSGSGRNLDSNGNSGFDSGKIWVFSFGQNFGSKVNQNLIKIALRFDQNSTKMGKFHNPKL